MFAHGQGTNFASTADGMDERKLAISAFGKCRHSGRRFNSQLANRDYQVSFRVILVRRNYLLNDLF